MTRRYIPIGLLVLLSVAVASVPSRVRAQSKSASARITELAQENPESVGFSSPRLERLHAMLQKEVDDLPRWHALDKQLPGIVTVLARHGKIVDYQPYGKRDLASGAAMTKDTIFRIYSMTKPITGVAMMILYDQAKWSPDDPIAKYIPEFAHLKVFKNLDSNGQPILADPVHAPIVAELMSHNAGFASGFTPISHVDKMYSEADLRLCSSAANKNEKQKRHSFHVSSAEK